MLSLRDKTKIIIPLMMLADFVPVMVSLLAYPLGGPGEIVLFFIFLPTLLILNYKYTNNVAGLVILSVCLIASTVLSSLLSTHLYYTKINDDNMTLVVGEAIMYAEAALAFLSNVISIIIKAVQKNGKTIKDNC